MHTLPPLPLEPTVPLYVDLDGSLSKTDTLWEGIWLAARKHPLSFLLACLNIGLGRAQFKRRIATLAPIVPSQLPFRKDVLDFISAEANLGRPLILATAADELVARAVAKHLGCFTNVISSDGVINCKGQAKLKAIHDATTRFVYLGDSTADLRVWNSAIGAIVVGSNKTVLASLHRSDATIYHHFPSHIAPFRILRRAIRVHQWPKNLLVLLPIFLGHMTMEIRTWYCGLLGMLAFCLTASLAYVLNDLMDLEADRQHTTKCARPFASGDLSIPTGLVLMAALGSASFVVCFFLPQPARWWIATYFGATLLYSFYLKTRLLADVIFLAILYVLRVMVGGSATAIAISPWTLAFCLFFFYSLALVKRFGELRRLPDDQAVAVRRGYQKTDLSVIAPIGVSSGILSVVVFALYISSTDVRAHYCAPAWLWLACPVILYWFGRLWILANRGVIAEDPMLFSLKDRISHCAGACIVVVWLVASICR